MDKGIIYRGPSQLDGSPIVVIATATKSNAKTGAVLQTYILRADMHPLEASKSGADAAICGNCPLRGEVTQDPARKTAKNRGCYVNLGQGPSSVYRAMLRGFYPDATQDPAAIGRGKIVRVGTYGDPAAVPDAVWDSLLSGASAWTAYTHQAAWRPDVAMQSADTLAIARDHWSQGRRTFRVVGKTEDLQASEILCPASKEAGYRTTCAACKLCAGTSTKSAKSIAIVAHGSGRNFVRAA